ncbi:hypothetical protein K3G63_17965 [Hymenobacter sp. HSC-4F20]|uniref:hypothetical protein n=1 Tax=Hymenobacter sp. HSC-4F20 TaxID=2864135 RepID=UPI001C73A639|nr:hypothetical protein [Hymenobacter sp. HSC-4F20]MBX0292338.1 hypothetical protein [Hymenobacter sp. HSC-4F20]
MKCSLFPTILLLGSLTAAQAQTSVVVNPDGTHSVLHQTGSSAVLVNPNGTHTVVPNVESNPTVIVNPDGTHSVLHRHGSTNLLVTPNGAHQVLTTTTPDTTHYLRLLRIKKRKK